MQDMKYEVQEFMVSNEEQMKNLEEWSNQLEERVLRYVLVDKLKNEVRATIKKEEDPREAEGGREAQGEVSKTDGRRVGNREEEAGNSEEEL